MSEKRFLAIAGGLILAVLGFSLGIGLALRRAEATPPDMPPGASNIIRRGPGELGWSFGHGSPTGDCLPGALYSNVDGKAGSTLYVCESGTWSAK
jgi:hypothetical protein